MKKNLTKGFLAALLLGSTSLLSAQVRTFEVDRTKYPDYSEKINPDWSLMPAERETKAQSRNRSTSQRPDHVHNGQNRYFPPVFNQDGGSCGSASRISYMFSYELAAYRNLDGSDPHNYYPSHFVWLHTNSPSSPVGQGKDDFVMKVGVPSAATYGGQTYSSLFGYQEESNEDFGWMQGYDKWFEAMHNRMLKPSNFPVSVATEEGREAVKNWLWNHNGDNSFQAGGICGIGVASACETSAIPSTDKNVKNGLAGMQYVMHWGEQVDHALTIVGYDDRIEFDLDGDGVYGEPEADELGAWIIVNSWGDGWKNGGFVYCPYAKAMPTKNSVLLQNAWQPEIYRVRKDYRPLRTIKLEMDYSRRSEIALSAGISADLNATEPEKSVAFVHFSYAGDGNYGNSNPAPEIPMLGRWADGKLHTEPMEFGYDLTDLSAEFDVSQPLKYFFVVDTRSWAQGEGTIHSASIIDYRFNELGVETPFAVGEGIEICNAGEKTIISVIVQGSGYYKAQNVAYADGTLSWQAPMPSANSVMEYNIYYNGAHVATQPAGVYTYQPTTAPTMGEYAVSVVYSDGHESESVVARVPLVQANYNVGVQYDNAGFSIPGVMTSRYDEATIEFWIKPRTLEYWNQSAGPGWGNFMFHADGAGAFFAGWNTSSGDRANTSNGTLSVGTWAHVAIVVKKNQTSIYINGSRRSYCTSSKYSGVGGFGDLAFAHSNSVAPNGAQDAVYDEIRIWNVARTAVEIQACMNVEFTGSVVPQGLIAYLKGDFIADKDGNALLYDCVGGYHATPMGPYTVVNTDALELSASNEDIAISIDEPTGGVYAGVPVTLTATYNAAVTRMAWSAEGAGVENLGVVSPTMTFAATGTYTVSVTAYAADGSSAVATREITVVEAPEVEATFTMTADKVPAGERVTFHADSPQVGYSYRWSMPGANDEEGTSPSVATTYDAKGVYNVTLAVMAPDGSEKSQTKQIEVLEVAPKAAFSIAPAVVVKGEEVDLSDESLYAPTRWEWHLGSTEANYIAYDQYKTLVMDKPGVYDVTLTVTNAEGYDKLTRERALIVTNADSKNGLNFSYDNAVVATAAGISPIRAGQSAFTIDWWMNSAWLSTFCNGIGEGDQTMIIKSNAEGKMTLSVGGQSAVSATDFVVPGEWHHYAVTYASGTVKFYRDGVLITTQNNATASTVPAMETFSIGTAEVPFKGSIDELRVWSRVLTEAQLRNYANSPITDVTSAESNHGLVLYYSFNQNGGDVQDATSNGYHGRRTGFGPDGDAWGLSRGVFCLNFDESASEDVTATYLTNYKKSFTDNGTCINPNLSSRTFALTGWTLENTITDGSIITGAHVDREKARCMTVTTQWDGFATTLNDHKVFQTITLPAGYYTFEAMYDNTNVGQCGGSYLVASKGNTLPVTDDLDQTIAYTAMVPKGQVMSNSVGFALAEETTVSIGLLVNMSGKICMALQRFTLTRSDVTVFEKASDALPSIAKLSNERLYYISLPYHASGLASWAIAQGGSELKSNVDLGIKADRDDTMQQFAILSNDEGATHYLYHAAEKKFVGKEGKLTDEPVEPIYFKEGYYDTTYVAYFDETHYINVGGGQQMVIDDYATPDGGNSIIIRPAKSFNPKAALAKFPAVAVTDITLNHSEVTLMAGDAIALQVTIAPTYATDPTVTWSSSDNSVAIVVRGVVTAVAPGKATITAKAGDVEATCEVIVEKRYVAVMGVIMSQSTATVIEGDTLTLTATVTPADADEQAVTWETSDTTIATVENGVVTTYVPGKVTITARVGDRQATCTVTVSKRYVPVSEIVFRYTELELEVGEKFKLEYEVLPEDADNKVLSWSTSDKNVVTLSRGSTMIAKGPGEAIVTAKAKVDGNEAYCKVTVKESTGVDQTISGEASTMDIYDLTGRPVRLKVQSTDGLNAGIYIINGRKVVIK